VWTAVATDFRPFLAAGEKATVAVIAADRAQARVAFRYITGLIDAVPMLAARVVRRTASAIELEGNLVIEVHTCSFRSVRGYSFAAVIADEVAFWRDEGSASPDTEVIAAVRPGLATLRGSLIGISSPYSRRGVLWQAWRSHWGRDGDVLVWQAPTRLMNEGIPQAVVDEALAEDEAAARAEYLAEWRKDVEQLVSREAVEACVVPGRLELPPVAGISGYSAFCDPSGGSMDSMTLAVAHAEGERIVLDCVREVRPPFSPDAVVEEFAALLKSYRVHTVRGDRYGGDWVASRFQANGITYTPAERTKSQIYCEVLPLLNAGRIELLDVPRLLNQLTGLERRTARGGRDSIDHAPGAHDDLVNAAALACVMCVGPVEPHFLAWMRGKVEQRQRGIGVVAP
jgi:hypothetical protein